MNKKLLEVAEIVGYALHTNAMMCINIFGINIVFDKGSIFIDNVRVCKDDIYRFLIEQDPCDMQLYKVKGGK